MKTMIKCPPFRGPQRPPSTEIKNNSDSMTIPVTYADSSMPASMLRQLLKQVHLKDSHQCSSTTALVSEPNLVNQPLIAPENKRRNPKSNCVPTCSSMDLNQVGLCHSPQNSVLRQNKKNIDAKHNYVGFIHVSAPAEVEHIIKEALTHEESIKRPHELYFIKAMKK